LIQGSIQPLPLSLAKADWQQAMCDVAVEQWRVAWKALQLDAAPIPRAKELTRAKYSRSEFNASH
jgi:hypothetical protein